MKCSVFFASIVGFAVLCTADVQADFIRADFTARVDSIFDSADLLMGQVAIGQTGSGFFLYDTDSADSDLSPDRGEYGPTSGFQFQLGGYLFQQDLQAPMGRILVVNDQDLFGDTFYWQSMSNLDTVPGDFDLTSVSMELRQFQAEGADVFDGDALPSSLSLDDFSTTNRYFSIQFEPGFQQVVNLTVTSLSVPEPGGMAVSSILVLAGLVRLRRA